jgi:hypothetical protein
MLEYWNDGMMGLEEFYLLKMIFYPLFYPIFHYSSDSIACGAKK